MSSLGPENPYRYEGRCFCGDRINLVTWDDHASNSRIVSLRCHELRVDQKIDFFALRQLHEPDGLIEAVLRQGERALWEECPERSVVPLGEVVHIRDKKRPVRPLPAREKAPAPRPSIAPTFGKPAPRKIIP